MTSSAADAALTTADLDLERDLDRGVDRGHVAGELVDVGIRAAAKTALDMRPAQRLLQPGQRNGERAVAAL